MSDETDRELTALFAQTAQQLPSDDFVPTLTDRLQARRRMRLLAFYCLAAVTVALLAAAAPYVARASIEGARAMTGSTAKLGEALISPVGVCASLLVGVLFLLRLRARLKR